MAAAFSGGLCARAYASFFRVIFHFGFIRYTANHQLAPMTFARVALLVDALWLICVVYTLVNAHFAREMRKKAKDFAREAAAHALSSSNRGGGALVGATQAIRRRIAGTSSRNMRGGSFAAGVKTIR